jgi:hypothetical protein
VRNLWAQGYRVLIAVGEEDAVERIGGVDADLLLVNLVGMTAEEVLPCEAIRFTPAIKGNPLPLSPTFLIPKTHHVS